MITRLRNHVETAAGLLALLLVSLGLLLIAGARPTDAYEGPFCVEEMRAPGVGCVSVSRSSIRRAIGHTKDAYSAVGIETTTGYLEGNCVTIECQASTGYLKTDGTGRGYIWNEGPNGSEKVTGYLYP
jgi:hypothetical protein